MAAEDTAVVEVDAWEVRFVVFDDLDGGGAVPRCAALPRAAECA